MRKQKVCIEAEPEGYLIFEPKSGAEYMGGDTYQEAVRTAENMGFIVCGSVPECSDDV